MATMRFVAFSLALCLLVGLATARKRGPTKRPPRNRPEGFPSRDPGSEIIPYTSERSDPSGDSASEIISYTSERSDPSGDSGKGGEKEKNKNRRNRRKRRDIIPYVA
ncbi:hypothetical protein V5799_015993 [Amblyomma americanum]|uniref:Secreted protein n=1 Tax=Amblyomma americanum TaxID=6943 RepID=A0AAQ4F7Q4_AMBAM